MLKVDTTQRSQFWGLQSPLRRDWLAWLSIGFSLSTLVWALALGDKSWFLSIYGALSAGFMAGLVLGTAREYSRGLQRGPEQTGG